LVQRKIWKKKILREILTGNQANELRNLGALACKIRYKWEDWEKEVVLSLGRGEELDST
jgi:hypothetical protein